MTPDEADLDAAITAISDPQRLRAAQDLVARATPELQKVLASALAEGGWFDTAHDAAVHEAIGHADASERLRAVRTLCAEETRLSMLVGVAVGFELARELGHAAADSDADRSEPDADSEAGRSEPDAPRR